jgi:hypothetical protein
MKWKHVIGGAVVVASTWVISTLPAMAQRFYTDGWIQCPIIYIVTDPFDGSRREQVEYNTINADEFSRVFYTYNDARRGLAETVTAYQMQNCIGYIAIYDYRTGAEATGTRVQL